VISLAWLQLKREKLRLLVAIAGVSFAVILIFMQLGFENALFDSATRFHERLRGQIVMISPQFDFLAQPMNFSRRRLYQAQSFPGVESTHSVYLGVTLWKNPWNGQSRSIFVVGVDPSEDVLDIAELTSQREKLKYPDVALFDSVGRPEYGPVAAELRAGRSVAAEVLNRRIEVVGLFQLGTSFGVDGTLITSDLNFLRIYPNRDRGLINIGLIRLAPGVDMIATRDAMRAVFPNDVLILTTEEYILREQHYWGTATPIGFIFMFGTVMGFVVGAIIVYQILFADVTEHLAEYATLKAMGYSNSYLFSVVLQEAVILAFLGYIPGLLICWGLYRLTANATGLPMNMTFDVASSVLLLAVIM